MAIPVWDRTATGDARVLDRAALWIYGTVFCSILATGLGAPVPEELFIVGAGVTCGHNRAERDLSIEQTVAVLAADPTLPFPANIAWVALNEAPAIARPEPPPTVGLKWYFMLPICVLGVVIGDGFLYGIGRIWGTRLVDSRWMQRVLPEHKKLKIEDNFHRYGIWVLLFARLLPTIRSPIYMMAGVMRIPFKVFLLADGLYAIPGVSLLFLPGLLARAINSARPGSGVRRKNRRIPANPGPIGVGGDYRLPDLSLFPSSRGNRRSAVGSAGDWRQGGPTFPR